MTVWMLYVKWLYVYVSWATNAWKINWFTQISNQIVGLCAVTYSWLLQPIGCSWRSCILCIMAVYLCFSLCFSVFHCWGWVWSFNETAINIHKYTLKMSFPKLLRALSASWRRNSWGRAPSICTSACLVQVFAFYKCFLLRKPFLNYCLYQIIFAGDWKVLGFLVEIGFFCWSFMCKSVLRQ